MKHVYKVTRANEWKNFKSILVTVFAVVILGPIFLYLRTSPEEDLTDYLFLIPIALLLFLIPQSIIHLSYDAINKGMEMIYDDMEKRVVIKNTKENTVSEFYLNDISHISHVSTPAFAEKRMEWFPWDSYNYSDILLKDGRKFRITSLMVYRLELPVGDRYEVVKRLYPYPSS
jgi:hypothetical protein